MQKYTELKWRELRDNFVPKMFDEWDEAITSWSGRGFDLPDGQLFSAIRNIGRKYLDKMLEELMSAEKASLMREPTLPTSADFDTTQREFTEIALEHLDIVNSRLNRYEGDEEEAREGSIERYQQAVSENDKEKYRSLIKNNIDLLQEELRLKIVSPGSTVVHIGGDAGVVNIGTVYGSVHGQIEKLKGTSSADIAELFDKLLAEIRASKISEDQKVEQMQNVELLVSQCDVPPEQRKRGLVSASLKFLSLASNLTTLWTHYGQAISEVFK